MDNFTAMQVSKPFNELRDEILDLVLAKSLPFLQYIIQSVITAQLKQNVNILVVFKDMIKADDSAML